MFVYFNRFMSSESIFCRLMAANRIGVFGVLTRVIVQREGKGFWNLNWVGRKCQSVTALLTRGYTPLETVVGHLLCHEAVSLDRPFFLTIITLFRAVPFCIEPYGMYACTRLCVCVGRTLQRRHVCTKHYNNVYVYIYIVVNKTSIAWLWSAVE